METKTVKIASLLADPANARKHDTKNIDAIKASLKQFGQRKNIVVRDGIIIAGNGTVEAAKQLGWDDITIAVADDMSATEAKAFALADNRTAELAVWDDDVLGEQLQALYEDGYAIADIGFDWEDNNKAGGGGNTDEDEIPEVEENFFGVKRGDIWQLGDHRLMCGDSTSKDDVDRLMNGEKADMVFTDPPYGIDLDTDYTKMGDKALKHRKVEGDLEYFEPKFIFDLFGYCKEIFLFGANYYCWSLPRNGSWVCWDKRSQGEDRIGMMDNSFGSDIELCWSKKKHKMTIARVLRPTGYFVAKTDERYVHPTQKPVALAEWFFDRWGKDKNLVVDLFLGSGSTLIACEKTNRKCYGSEIDAHYCSVIIKRWQDYTGKEACKTSG